MDILEHIKSLYPTFTRKQRSIADYLISNPEDICYVTLAQLSQQVGASELTLLRFCEKIGCSSFLELKDKFRDYTQHMIKLLSAPTYFLPEQTVANDADKESLLRDICIQESVTVTDFFAAVNLADIMTAASLIQKSQRIFIFAHDISKTLGEFLSARLQLLNFHAVLIDLDDLAQTQQFLQQLTKEDLAIFFSFPKYYYPIGSIAKKAIEKAGSLLAITDNVTSPVAQCCSHLLLCQTSTRMFYNSLTVPMALLNLLASCLVIDMVPASEREEFIDTLPS
ncbi:MurR/RpiR family transcriptional regulator [Clostridium sp. AF19-22AC]|jgi:DNA-binding MurR/RpiR family transcriptional regulator|uniref:RpiR family transcriptional regulator n=1 Tax=Faecalicatena orotica TaxID=1544 RepID=A0A2Y9BJ20_9FIRM|nr:MULTISPECIES: MurR/RpiR family transcriptional regulator [Clostridia]PWJ27833.1 RpiR family transcriptional regulator [Faecalicatena orotica]RHR29861.1 MurR/RpiR family transcriptional regulator [Clostridium sp. AF19-22AC]SSA56854.1 transcriptional regulator, RpiR family [Faecalicatena orotica]